MPYSAEKVANRLLQLASQKGETIDPLKLLKLVYISHGWNFPNHNAPLVTDEIQAWQYGPVIPSLYHKVKDFRYSPVTGLISENDRDVSISSDDDAVISAVYNVYGKYSGIELSNLTHRPGTPWDITWHKFGRNMKIPNTLISEHYKKLAGK